MFIIITIIIYLYLVFFKIILALVHVGTETNLLDF